MRKKIIIGIVILVLFAACGTGAYFFVVARPAEDANAPEETAQIVRGDLAVNVRASGTLRAQANTLLQVDPQTKVAQLYAHTGDTVKRDQVLAELDTTRLKLALAQAQAAFNQQQLNLAQVQAGADATELDAARAALASAQANYDAAVNKAGLKNDQILIAQTALDKAELALQKAQSAYDQAVVEQAGSQLELAEALAQAKMDYAAAQSNFRLQIAAIEDAGVSGAASALASAKASLSKLENSPTPREVAAAQTQLEQARIALAQAQLDLRNGQLVAPFGGTVTQINLAGFESVGNLETQGIQIADMQNLQVVVSVPEIDVVHIQAGQPVTLEFDVVPDKSFEGRVVQVGLVGTIDQGVTLYPVLISLQNGDPALRLNMAANVSILVDERHNILLVPNRAIQRNEGRIFVETRAGDETKQVDITLGVSSDGQTEVLSGLSENDMVVLPPINVPFNTGF